MTKVTVMKHLILWVSLLLINIPAIAQVQFTPFNEVLYQGLEWRNIGPFRGGRCVAIAGIPNDPLIYYMGTTGGGVWKTEDAGLSWNNISDGYFEVGSIGAITLAPSDPNTIYVGTGEHPIRGVMTSHGKGLYRSTDGGVSWKAIGLKGTRHIASIQVHPYNPDIVVVAAQGAAHGPSEERGIYRTTNGGTSWERVLYINETTGAADLSMDMQNPRILYATMWDHMRHPWQIRSGGEGSGLYKSVDGGLNWEKMCHGLPKKIGKAGIAVSPANSDIVYAVIEGEDGGVYRSMDAGKSWEAMSFDRVTVARAWYYMEIVPDPNDESTIYILNAPLLKSIDGGKTFEAIPNPHSDQHALWINPYNSNWMALGNDGGATVSLNGGKNWSSQNNQPTAQFYRVIADKRFPYHVYGGQQDNSTIAIPSRTMKAGISAQDWYPVAGGESAFIAFDPDNPEIIYGGSYQGNISRYNSITKSTKDIMAYPSLSLGKVPSEMKYRFNWNAPIIVNPRKPNILYHAANVVFQSNDGGYNWDVISPDLTRDEQEKQGKGGAPYTNEGAGGENYNTISYLACSAFEKGVIWAGSDDGLLHITHDDGQNWEEITPPEMGEALINCIELSPHNPAAAYIVATRYRFNDFRPMAYYTKDYGKSWTKIIHGIPGDDFLRVIREDKKQAGLLYAGSETGFYISFNNGNKWNQLQLNLPVCPITDLCIRDNDLIAATSGRGYWILDDLSVLQQSKKGLSKRPLLFAPKSSIRLAADLPEQTPTGIGTNPPNGVLIDYYLPEQLDSQEVILKILDAYGNEVRSYSNQEDDSLEVYEGGPETAPLLPDKKGVNRFNWDLRRAPLQGIKGVYVPGNYEAGMVSPGQYTIQLILPGKTLTADCEIISDPRLNVNSQDFRTQQEILLAIENNIRDIHDAVNSMRDIRMQLVTLQENLKKTDCTKELISAGDTIVHRIDKWEENIIQARHKTHQDIINFPNRLNAELIDLKTRVDSHDPRVTAGTQERLADLLQEWAQFRQQMRKILDKDIAAFNELYNQYQIPAIIMPLGAE